MAEWDGMGCYGLGWDRWDGMGWDGMGWDGMGWDGMVIIGFRLSKSSALGAPLPWY